MLRTPAKRARAAVVVVTPVKKRARPSAACRPAWALEGLRHVGAAHLRLAALIEEHGEPAYFDAAPEAPFVALCKIVVGQQLAGAAARAIWRRTRQAFQGGDDDAVTPVAVLRWAMNDELDEGIRAAAGLSRAKARAIVGIAHAFEAGVLTEANLSFAGGADASAVRDQLIALRGLGPWSVDMFLLFHLKFPDVLPLGDLAVRAGAAKAFQARGSLKNGALCPNKDRALLETLFEPFRPYRSIAAFYMWRCLDSKSPFDDDDDDDDNASKTPPLEEEQDQHQQHQQQHQQQQQEKPPASSPV